MRGNLNEHPDDLRFALVKLLVFGQFNTTKKKSTFRTRRSFVVLLVDFVGHYGN